MKRSRVLVLAHDCLWPENHGYRIDVARRLRKLQQLGVDIGLISLSRDTSGVRPDNDAVESTMRQCFFRGDYASPVAALLNTKLPWPAAARSLPERRYAALIEHVKKFGPTSILVEGLYSAGLAKQLQSDLADKVQIFYRSHNVEHSYMLGQLHAAKGLKSTLNLALSVRGLKRFELSALAASCEILDISWEDAAFWRQTLMREVHWMPPLPGSMLGASPGVARWDFAYCGNLNAPNNVEAIQWFVRYVWPAYLRDCDARAKLVLAGSRPSYAVQQLSKGHPNITLIADPPSMHEVHRLSRVLINPALSGSGVNIKTIDMLFSNRPLVVSQAAVKGLPPFAINALGVATGPNEWVTAMQKALDAPNESAGRLADEYREATERAYAKLSTLLLRQ